MDIRFGEHIPGIHNVEVYARCSYNTLFLKVYKLSGVPSLPKAAWHSERNLE